MQRRFGYFFFFTLNFFSPICSFFPSSCTRINCIVKVRVPNTNKRVFPFFFPDYISITAITSTVNNIKTHSSCEPGYGREYFDFTKRFSAET